MVDVGMRLMPPKLIGKKNLFMGYKSFKAIKGPYTQEAFKHMKEG
jgi:hypothetical protein